MLCRFAVAAWLASTLTLASVSSTVADVALEPAILSDDIDRVQAALDAGGDPNEVFPIHDTSALMLAAIRGNEPVVALLLEAGADVNWVGERGYSALSAAVRSCRAGWDVVETLINAGADIDNRSGASLTPLMVAVQEERPTFFRRLLEHGAAVDALNAYGEGALNYAIYYRKPDHISLLLDHDVDTGPLRRLFTGLYTYYYPGFGEPRSRTADCAR